MDEALGFLIAAIIGLFAPFLVIYAAGAFMYLDFFWVTQITDGARLVIFIVSAIFSLILIGAAS